MEKVSLELAGVLDKENFPGFTDNRFSSVEFCVKSLNSVYQFKIWDADSSGINILVNQNSALLKCITVGSKFDIKYYPCDCSEYPVTKQTEIRHIKKENESRIKGHFLVGLEVNEIASKN